MSLQFCDSEAQNHIIFCELVVHPANGLFCVPSSRLSCQRHRQLYLNRLFINSIMHMRQHSSKYCNESNVAKHHARSPTISRIQHWVASALAFLDTNRFFIYWNLSRECQTHGQTKLDEFLSTQLSLPSLVCLQTSFHWAVRNFEVQFLLIAFPGQKKSLQHQQSELNSSGLQ